VPPPFPGETPAQPANAAAWAPGDDEAPPTPPRRVSRGRRLLIGLGLFGGILAAVVAVLVVWPAWHPKPTDPSEVAATAYLDALAKGDMEKARLLGTVEEPPAIRSFDSPRRLTARRDQKLRGSFAPIARLHERIDKQYTFDADLGRFQVKNALGPAASTLDALHEAKAKAEHDRMYEKMASGNPDDLFDAAEALGTMFTKLAEGALAPQKLLPTYAQLVKESKPPLPPESETLAKAFGDDPGAWNTLLKRPFHTLKADGPFILDRVEVTTQVRDSLASSGDPPSTLRLTLTRFRLEGIDTGWKVTAARRQLTDSSSGLNDTPSESSRSSRSEPSDRR
jgi:hypothetical protein